MTIREAAHVLSVSELTIRRRIKDRRLAYRLENGKYYVNVAQPAASEDRPAKGRAGDGGERPASETASPIGKSSHLTTQSEPDLPDGETDASGATPGFNLDSLLAEHGRLAELAGRAGLLEEQVSELSERNARLQEDVVSLAGRNGWLESKLEERERELKLLTDSRHRVSFWKRLFGGGSGE
jgi:hypothetical protein